MTPGPLGDSETIRALSYDAAGCLREVSSKTYPGGGLLTQASTEHICGQGGEIACRKSTSSAGTERVLQFAGLAELRLDEGRDDDGDGQPKLFSSAMRR